MIIVINLFIIELANLFNLVCMYGCFRFFYFYHYLILLNDLFHLNKVGFSSSTNNNKKVKVYSYGYDGQVL